MRVLITAGGTREDIDAVRGISNYATGRLGSIIAEQFLQANDEVSYLCGENSAEPETACEIIKIRSVKDLTEKLNSLLNRYEYDCIIHSMAVSDYSVKGYVPLDTPEEPLNNLEKPADKKISSKSPYLAVVLEQQPKVIQLFKAIQPKAVLVGFKLLSNSSEKELIKAAEKLIAQSGCDYVLANDLSNITADRHEAVLLNGGAVISRMKTKEEIAKIIYKEVKNAKNYSGN